LLDFFFEKLEDNNNLIIARKPEFHNVTKHFVSIPDSLVYKNNKIDISGSFTLPASGLNI
jgi:hypothetical protein